MSEEQNDWFHRARRSLAESKEDLVRFRKLYSSAAREVVRDAIAEAERLGSDVIGAEHLFISFATKPSATASIFPPELAIVADALTEEIRSSRRGNSKNPKLLFSPRMSGIIRNSRKAAAALGQSCVEPEHLFLSLLAESGGHLARLLRDRGLDREAMHAWLKKKLPAEEKG